MIQYMEQVVVVGGLFLDYIEIVRNRKSKYFLKVKLIKPVLAYGNQTQLNKKTFIYYYYVIYERVINI